MGIGDGVGSKGQVHFRCYAQTYNFLPPESLPAATEWEKYRRQSQGPCASGVVPW